MNISNQMNKYKLYNSHLSSKSVIKKNSIGKIMHKNYPKNSNALNNSSFVKPYIVCLMQRSCKSSFLRLFFVVKENVKRKTINFKEKIKLQIHQICYSRLINSYFSIYTLQKHNTAKT